MKNNFLPIPGFLNYEINSELVVRDKTSGRILKTYCYEAGYSFVYLYKGDSRFTRNPKKLRKIAVSADRWANSEFFPVPSLGGKYEINRLGVLRISKSKYPVDCLEGQKSFTIYLNGKKSTIARNTLLNEVFGTQLGFRRVQLFLSKGNRRYHFDTAADAARFLAPIVNLVPRTIVVYFRRRLTIIHGWRVNYVNDLN